MKLENIELASELLEDIKKCDNFINTKIEKLTIICNEDDGNYESEIDISNKGIIKKIKDIIDEYLTKVEINKYKEIEELDKK